MAAFKVGDMVWLEESALEPGLPRWNTDSDTGATGNYLQAKVVRNPHDGPLALSIQGEIWQVWGEALKHIWAQEPQPPGLPDVTVPEDESLAPNTLAVDFSIGDFSGTIIWEGREPVSGLRQIGDMLSQIRGTGGR